MNRTLRAALSAAVAGALVASCGGSDDNSSDDATAGDADASESTSEPTSESTTDAPSGTSAPTDTVPTADYDEGDIGFRVVNALGDPVDVYVRTTGLVEAFAIEQGVEPGAVTELAYPPDDGVFLVTEAGGGDPTCVSGCDHFIAELSTFPEEGPVRTVVLYDDEFDGPSAFDLWEQPDESRSGNANAMAPADPASGVVVVTAIAVTDADFGLRLAVDGAGICEEPFNLDNVLIGGNQTPAFTYDGDSVDVTIHANDDRECSEAPVGGPFTIDGGPGERSHLILFGSPGDLDAIVVPMVDATTDSDEVTEQGTTGDDEEQGASGDRATAIDLMTAEVEANLPVQGEQAECLATLLVDGIGVENLLDGGQLVDLDALPSEFDADAETAIIQSIDVCGIDPSALG